MNSYAKRSKTLRNDYERKGIIMDRFLQTISILQTIKKDIRKRELIKIGAMDNNS
jgi:hypothetical protein